MTASTAATATDLQAYKDKVAKLPTDKVLGTILWFSITGSVERVVSATNTTRHQVVPVRVTREQLEAWFTDLGLDKAFLPPAIAKVNAFRKASTDTERTFNVNADEVQRLFTKEIDFNEEYVLRHIHREVANKKTQTTTYAHVATLKFFRGARSSGGKRHSSEHYVPTILTTLTEIGLDNRPTGNRYKLSDEDKARVENFIADFDTQYTDLSANLTSQAIRKIIRDYVSSLNAIVLRPSGGVYFVHSSRQQTLDALQELVRRIGQGCSFHQVPLVDTDEQRVMLTDALQSEIEDECQGLLKKLMEINEVASKKGGKVTAAQYAGLKNEWDELAVRSEEYTRVLGLAQGRAGAAMDLALDSIIGLIDRIDTGKKTR